MTAAVCNGRQHSMDCALLDLLRHESTNACVKMTAAVCLQYASVEVTAAVCHGRQHTMDCALPDSLREAVEHRCVR
eukprot:1144270-Pelagomonas_calceolata.AAC.20